MSKLSIPCTNNCICLPMCFNRVVSDLFDCCKLMSNHWYKYVSAVKVHRRLSMQRAYNFTTQMNKILKKEFVPFIYHDQLINRVSLKSEFRDIVIFADANQVQHMIAKNVSHTLLEYKKIGINLLSDKYVGQILRDSLDTVSDRTFDK